jgi:hypothetical protein
MPGTYEITRDDRTIAEPRFFRSDAEILESIEAQPPGLYDVYRFLGRDPSGTANWESCFQARRLQNGEVLKVREVEVELVE